MPSLYAIEKELDSFVREFLTAQRGTEAALRTSRLRVILRRSEQRYPLLALLAARYSRRFSVFFSLVLDAIEKMYDGRVVFDYKQRAWRFEGVREVAYKKKAAIFSLIG